MRVLYTAPNRGHHYLYAEGFYKSKTLHAFVSGFSRFSSRANNIDVGSKLKRADRLQNIYLAALKCRLPKVFCDELSYHAKVEQDKSCIKYLQGADIFLFYNGSGLTTLEFAKKKDIVTVVEVVNSHVQHQESILEDEYEKLHLQWTPFHKKEKERRMLEYEMADYILLPSEFVRRSFLKYGFPESKLLKVPYGFNRFSNEKNETMVKKGNFTVLFVGSVSVRKGLIYLLKAFNRLVHPHKKLIITGPVDKVSGIDIGYANPNVIFTGVLKGSALENVYKSADVFCLPSIEDGFGLVLGEALSFGLPIIATENSGASDIITNEKEGFIIPIRSAEMILQKLELLANSQERLDRMKRASRDRSFELHGWVQTQQMLVDSLKKICE